MKTSTLTPKQIRQRKVLLVLPLLVLPFLTLFFWALGGGKGSQALAQTSTNKGFNTQLPVARLKDSGTVNKLSYYDRATQDSNKLQQQMKSDPYYHAQAKNDTANLHFPVMTSKLAGSGNADPSANAAKVYKQLAALQTAINKPATANDNPAKLNNNPPTSTPVLPKSQLAAEDPQLMQMNGLLEKILDIQHPERLKQTNGATDNKPAVKKFRAIPAVVDGTQKIVQGTVICMKLLDSVTIGGQFFPKGQKVYGSGNLGSQRYTLNIKSIHVGASFYPVDLTVFDEADGMEGISVPEAVTADAVRDGAVTGVQGMDLMSFDPSVGAQLTTAGINTVKDAFGKKVKRVKGKIKNGHLILLRDNQSIKN